MEYEQAGNMRYLKNTTLRTQCTFIGLGTEEKVKYDKFVGKGMEHVVFTNTQNIGDMNVIASTQQIFQVQGCKYLHERGWKIERVEELKEGGS
eukprot:13146668-Ditylum_brightwellii.AAC.1